MRADAKTEAEVIAVINQVKEAFNKRDLNSIPALFAPDPDAVFYGTGADEKVLDKPILKLTGNGLLRILGFCSISPGSRNDTVMVRHQPQTQQY